MNIVRIGITITVSFLILKKRKLYNVKKRNPEVVTAHVCHAVGRLGQTDVSCLIMYNEKFRGNKTILMILYNVSTLIAFLL